ncbi:unnamed protein product, partial [Effrenium voratum]
KSSCSWEGVARQNPETSMFELRARGEHDAQQANLGGVVTTDAASTFHKSQRSGALDSRECPAQQVRDLLKNACKDAGAVEQSLAEALAADAAKVHDLVLLRHRFFRL